MKREKKSIFQETLITPVQQRLTLVDGCIHETQQDTQKKTSKEQVKQQEHNLAIVSKNHFLVPVLSKHSDVNGLLFYTSCKNVYLNIQ